MDEVFIGTVMPFSFGFVPKGWAACDGQLLPVSQHDALFSLLGTTYGGDGRTTFGLPDLRGRVAVHQGRGPGLTPMIMGQHPGEEVVTLTTDQLSSHNHAASISNVTGKIECNSGTGNTDSPVGHSICKSERTNIYSTNAPDQPMADGSVVLNGGSVAIGDTGGTQPHLNIQPSLATNYCIALVGIYPSRD